jgi:acetylornithine deacetylase/succinyl-diaminopimelate desuccinylase-like protein
MAPPLRAAGFTGSDVQVLAAAPRKGNLATHLHGTGGRKPLRLLAHTELSMPGLEDWSLNPFKLTKKEGCFYVAVPPTTRSWPQRSSQS